MGTSLIRRVPMRWSRRLLLPLVVTAALVCALAPANAASSVGSATFSAVAPQDGSVIEVARPQLKATAFDPAEIKMERGTYAMTLDGVALRPSFSYKILGWSGSTPILDKRYTTLVSTLRSDVGYGVHTVTATVTNAAGVVSTHTWTFARSGAPVLADPQPTPDSTITDTTPMLSVRVLSGAAGVFGTFTVDGHPIAGVYDSGTGLLSAQVTTPLVPGTTSNVSVTAGNIAGSTVLSWSFVVQARLPMSVVSDCVSCHTDQPRAHPMENCAACHGPGGPTAEVDTASSPFPHSYGYLTGVAWGCPACHGAAYAGVPSLHSFNPDPYHQSPDSCGPCHSGSLSIEHSGRVTAGGSAFTCLTCHASGDSAVQSAVAAGNTACTGCHAIVNHEAPHVTTLAADCAGCHKSSISAEHARTSSSSSASGCAACHPTPRDTFTAWDHTCAQGGCHVAGSPAAQHAQIDAKHAVGPVTCLAADCHAGTIPALHSLATTTTAGVTRTGCNVCHTPDVVPASTDCATCHPDRVAPHGYDAAKHASTIGADLATGTYSTGGTYAVRCDACHVTELGPEHTRTTSSSAAARCSACHPAPRNTLTPSWAKGCVQGGCHTPSGGSAQHGNMTAAHAEPSANASCLGADCHAGDLTAVHKNAPDQCLECHSATSVPSTNECEICHGAPHGDLTVRHTAAESGGLTWSGRTIDPDVGPWVMSTNPKYAPCSQCHYLDVRTEHAKASSGSLGCSACHVAGGPVSKLPTGGWTGRCSACHASIHPNYDAAHMTEAQDNCSDCHDPFADARTYHLSCGVAPTDGRTVNPETGSCHVSPAELPTTNLATETYWWCRSCHPNE